MSMLHPTEARQCKSCGNGWYAQAGYSSLKPGPILFDAGQNAALSHSRSKYEQHKFCPRCGSDKVKTNRSKGFVPTVAQQQAAPVVVNVQVNATVGAVEAQPPQPTQHTTPAQPAPVAAPFVPTQRSPAEPDTFTPSFRLPASDALSARLHPPVRNPSLGLGDHVHNAGCLDGTCELVGQQIPNNSPARYLTFAAWLVVAVFVWIVQYAITVPLGCLNAVAHTPKTRALGVFAIIFCGFGWAYTLVCFAAPAIPRDVLRPWGLAKPE